jgi:hypothetical protein
MTDYIKQVAEADQNLVEALEALMEWQVKNVRVWHNNAYDQAFAALASWKATRASVPGPEPVAYVSEKCMIWLKVNAEPLHTILYFDGHTHAFGGDTVPLYSFPPDAQAEVYRLNTEAEKREEFIERLIAARHVELMRASEATIDACRRFAYPLTDLSGVYAQPIVNKVEQERGE